MEIKYRYGNTITTTIVESKVNEVVSKCMVKKQQMQWSNKGAHYLLKRKKAVLNGELRDRFERWYAELTIRELAQESTLVIQEAA